MRHLNGLRTGLLSTAAFLGTAVGVNAQIPPPPVDQFTDDNNVDAITGQFSTSATDIAIGGQGTAGLAFSRSWNGGQVGWVHSYLMALIENGNGGFFVSIGGRSEEFLETSPSSSNFHGAGPTEGWLATLPNDYVYTKKDGTKIYFAPTPGVMMFPYGPIAAVARAIEYPDGTVVSLTYSETVLTGPSNESFAATRLESINSSRGFQLKLSYPEGSAAYSYEGWGSFARVTAINNSVEYCDPLANYCSLSHNWPHADYAWGAGGWATLLSYVTDPANRTTNYSYNSYNGQMTGIRRPGSSQDDVTIGYEALPGSIRVGSITKAGISQTYTYPAAYWSPPSGISRSGPSPYTTTLGQMFGWGRPIVTAKNAEFQTFYTYESSGPGWGEIKEVIYPTNTVTYTYDYYARVTQVKVASNANPGDYSTTQAAYDPNCSYHCYKPIAVTDPLGRTTNYEYGPAGLTKITYPADPNGIRPEVRTTYSGFHAYLKNSSGVLVASAETHYLPTVVSSCRTTAACANGADETRVQTGYGPQASGTANNLLPVTVTAGSGDGALAATTSVSYDDFGNATNVDGPLAGSADTTRTLYNAVGQVVGTMSPDPDGSGPLKHRAQRISYGADGQQTKVETGTTTGQSDWDWANTFQALEEVVTEFDAYGRPIITRHNAGGSTYGVVQTSYGSASGLEECRAVRMNPSAWNGLPADACTLGTQGGAGPDRITKITRDAYGRPTMAQSAYGTADVVDEQTSYSVTNGKVETAVDGNGNKTTVEYDAFGRVKKTLFPSPTTAGVSSTTDYTELSYDLAGNVTVERLRDGSTIGYTRDNLGRVTVEDRSGSGNDNQDITYTYDLQGRLRTSTSASGQLTNYTYDALGRGLSQTGTHGGTHTIEYDLAGRRTRLNWSDGFFVTYNHLVTGEVTAIRENGAVSGVGVLASYGYDDAGRMTTITRGNGTVTSIGYDAVSRLSSLTQDLGGSGYDITTSFTYNPASQIASAARSNNAYAWPGYVNVARPYVANGLNQYSSVAGTGFGYDARGNLTSDGTSSYTYSQRNRLVGGPGVTLDYDPAGRLDVTLTGGSGTAFTYDGADLIGELDYTSGAWLRRYVHGPGDDQPIVVYSGATTTSRRWLHGDERGSVIALTDASGGVTNVNAYDEYGIPASGNFGRFRYTGQAWIPELGMYYYKARMYSPTLGRFMQTDAIGYGDGMNIYAYVGNDPVNSTDPTGMIDPNSYNCHRSAAARSSGKTSDDGKTLVVTGAREICGQDAGSGQGDNFPFGAEAIEAMTVYGRRPQPSQTPQNKPCTAPLSSWVGATRGVLEWAATGTDIATVGLAAGGVTGPAAVGTKALGYVFEAGLGLVNAYDAYANNNPGPLAAQGASLGARLIPGGRALQSGLISARGSTGLLRNARGQFRSSHLNNPAIKEAGDLATQKASGGAVEAVICR